MRIKQLILEPFGKFRKKTFDIGDKPENGSDFHIFYGANEAGKTTIMEAWLRFLFGILPRETYDFEYKRQDLKISAVLQMQDKELHLTRVPDGRSSVLRDEHNQPVSAQVSASLTGEFSNADEYRNMLCLDDKSLEEGGEAIISSKGQLGELLFSAGSGLNFFSRLLRERAAETDALYKSSGRKTEFALKLNEYNEVSEKLKQISLTPDGYAQMGQHLRDSAENEKNLKEQRDLLRQKSNILHDVRRYYEAAEKLRDKISGQLAQMQKAAAELGVETDSAGATEIYSALRSFAINASDLQNLRKMQMDMSVTEEHIREKKSEIASLEDDLQQAQQKCAALKENLPPEEARRKLTDLLCDSAADDLKQNYITAEDNKKRLEEQARQALLALSFKGQSFDALPPSPLTEAETAAKLDKIKEIGIELDKRNEVLIAQKAEIEHIEKQLTDLRDEQGRRIMQANTAQNFQAERC